MKKNYISLIAAVSASTVMLSPIAIGDTKPSANSESSVSSSSSSEKSSKKDKDNSKSDSESKARVIAMGDSNLWSMRDVYMGSDGFESTLREAGFDVVVDSSPGRSMKEEVRGNQQKGGNYTNITDSIDALKKEHDGEDAIWVMAGGVNDSANVQAGSGYSNEKRIEGVMEKLGDDVTVIWPTVAVGKGAPAHYTDEGVKNFNEALHKAAEKHDNLFVMNWYEAVNPEWFKDGVHYKGSGYKAYIDLLVAHLDAAVDDELVREDSEGEDDFFHEVKSQHDYKKLVSPVKVEEQEDSSEDDEEDD